MRATHWWHGFLCLWLTDCQDELPASLPVSQFKANSLPTKVRAHGVITLGKQTLVLWFICKWCEKGCLFLQCFLTGSGKLCLQREDLVQKYLPVFARELELGTEVAVRNNIVVIMCDLCVRYTSRVDHYIPNISACLRDDEPVIREQTFIMLTNLLQVGRDWGSATMLSLCLCLKQCLKISVFPLIIEHSWRWTVKRHRCKTAKPSDVFVFCFLILGGVCEMEGFSILPLHSGASWSCSSHCEVKNA